jgi:hypothetical protein
MQSIVGRWQIWTDTAGMSREFPLLGIGWGAYPAVIPVFRDSGRGSSYDHAHNDYLELLAESGLLGTALAVAGIILILVPLIRRPTARPDYGLLGYGAAAGVMAICLHSLTDFNLAIPGNALTFSVLVGLLVSWRRVPAPTLAAGQSDRGRILEWRTTAIVLGLAVAAMMALSPVMPYASRPSAQPAINEEREGSLEMNSQLVRMIVDRGNPQRLLSLAATLGSHAQADMQALIELKPQGPFSDVTMEYIDRRLERAGALVAQSIRQRPTSATAHLALADLSVSRCAIASLVEQSELDCMGPAVAELAAAVEVNPMSARTHEKAAKLYLVAWPLLKDQERALASDVIRVALTSPRRDPDLLEAAVLRGFEP